MGKRIVVKLGDVFGKLTVLKTKEFIDSSGHRRILCRCECGKKKNINKYDMLRGDSKSCGCSKYPDLTGKRFGKLLVIGKVERRKHNNLYWLCKCDCTKERELPTSYLTRYKDSLSCGCSNKVYRKSENVQWMGYGEVSGQYLGSLRKSAKQRGYSFKISNEYLWNLFLKQNRKCALSGIEISFARTAKDTITNTASLDRIDSSLDYIDGNVQWVHKRVNVMKRDSTDKELFEWAKLIYDTNKEKWNV